MKSRLFLSCAVAFLAGAISVGALAQDGANRRAEAGTRSQAPRSYTAEMTAAAEAVGKAFEVKVVVDPALFVPAPPAEPKEAQSADAAVNALVAGLKNAAWRKVYLTQSEASAGIPAARLAAMVRAVDVLETGGLVLENPATRRAISLQKNMPILPGFAEELRSLRFNPAPVYVIYSTLGGGAGGSAEEKFLDLQRQQLELMMQMDPDALAETFAKGMQMWASLDPQTRSRMMANMMQAGTQMFMQMAPAARAELVGTMMRSSMEMWANMPAEQRQRLTQEMMQLGQQLGGQMGAPR